MGKQITDFLRLRQPGDTTLMRAAAEQIEALREQLAVANARADKAERMLSGDVYAELAVLYAQIDCGRKAHEENTELRARLAEAVGILQQINTSADWLTQRCLSSRGGHYQSVPVDAIYEKLLDILQWSSQALAAYDRRAESGGMMPYETKCRRCYGTGIIGYPQRLCDRCDGTGEEKPYRRQLTQFEAQEQGWGPINSWPRYGDTGFCRVCGVVLTGRRKTRCGNRVCDNLLWRRLYEGVSWQKRHVIVRDGCACRNCGEEFISPIIDGGPSYPMPSCLELDHVIPLIDGGGDLPDNLQLLCIDCHRPKTARENAIRLDAARKAGEEKL